MPPPSERSAEQALREQSVPVEKEELYRGKLISLYRYTQQLNGSKSWDIIAHPGAVALIPVTKNHELLLVKQWRRAIGRITLEFPAGTLEKGEEVVLCAQRELQEETGFRAGHLISLGGFYSTPGFCTEYLYLFLALDLEESPLSSEDPDEMIDLAVVSAKELAEMIKTGQIQDAKTIAGFYRYEQWLKEKT